MINSLCIVGGGTSGLITALMMKKGWPNLKITMIESSQIGIIGVGEGSTEHWKKFINHIGVGVPELVRETGATFKVGIKFTNWHGDGTHYFHSLSEQYGGMATENGLPFTWIRAVGENWDPLDTVWKLSRDSRHVEPLHEILSQYHFDTHKLNDFLHRLCKKRGIEIIDAEINNVVLDQQGNVEKLIDAQGTEHAYEFYVDCSGFKRIIGSKLNAKWIDRTSQLPMNSAIAFQTGYTEDIPSYTEATALSSGWCWRIPTQERYGNGYVFCDQFIDETNAYDEVSKHYKKLDITDNIQVGKKIKFGAGHVEEFWMKNCVMIGLSGIFVEPLEASSIGTTIQQCFLLLPAIAFWEKGDTKTAKGYNRHMSTISNNIVDFIQLHYFSQRQDSEFWKWCQHSLEWTDFNKENIEYFKKHFVNPHYFNAPLIMFSYLNYSQVMHGLRMFDPSRMNMLYNNHFLNYKASIDRVLLINDHDNIESFSHRESLNRLKERYDTIEIKI